MKLLSRIAIAACLLAVSIVPATHAAAAPSSAVSAPATADDVIERTFQVRPGGMLAIDTDRGAIDVESHDRNEVYVRIERTVRGGDESEIERMQFEFDQDGNTVRVIGEYEGRRRWGKNRVKVHILVRVPRAFNVISRPRAVPYRSRSSKAMSTPGRAAEA